MTFLLAVSDAAMHHQLSSAMRTWCASRQTSQPTLKKFGVAAAKVAERQFGAGGRQLRVIRPRSDSQWCVPPSRAAPLISVDVAFRQNAAARWNQSDQRRHGGCCTVQRGPSTVRRTRSVYCSIYNNVNNILLLARRALCGLYASPTVSSSTPLHGLEIPTGDWDIIRRGMCVRRAGRFTREGQAAERENGPT